MLIVSDTTPIISLMKIEQLYLLEKMFGYIVIPKAVYDELTVNEKFAKEILKIKEAEFVKVGEVKNDSSVNILRNVTGLDAGERSDIDLAVYGCSEFEKLYDALNEELWSLLALDIIDMRRNISEELKQEIERDGVILYEKV